MTNLEFIKKVKQIASEDTAFAFGAYGEIVNDELFVRTVRNQSERYHDKSNLTRLLDCYGKKAYECTALFTEPLEITRNEGIPNPNNLYELWSTRKWLIEDMPDISGLGVYLYGHVGVYIGNGQVIESTYSGGNFGVAATLLHDKPWTAAFAIKGVNYEGGF